MDLETFFVKTAEHLATQTTRSYTSQCVYAGPNDNACALGVHMPREVACTLDTLTDNSWNSVLDVARYAAEPYSEEQIEAAQYATELFSGIPEKVLTAAQEIHDEPMHMRRTTEDRISLVHKLAHVAETIAGRPDIAARLRSMDLETFFVKTAEHLAQQTDRSFAMQCDYAGPNPCALGVHMPRDVAEALDALEHSSWRCVLQAAAAGNEAALTAVAIFEGIPTMVLCDVQALHDSVQYASRTPEAKLNMLMRLAEIAADYGVKLETK